MYTAKGSFDKSHADRTNGAKIWEGLTDLTVFLPEGVYGGSGSSNPVMKAGSDVAQRIGPDGQTDITVKINWIEEIYVPN
ncbi:hypothetical protein ACN6K4_005647 [Streptomyces hayashii]|uniref:hypothetical protein n=1 Tax=Streptomyces hayashii TaxID=2839966 RepID=UPI00403D0B15